MAAFARRRVGAADVQSSVAVKPHSRCTESNATDRRPGSRPHVGTARGDSEMRRLYALGISYLGLTLALVVQDVWAALFPAPVPPPPAHGRAAAPSASSGSAWFAAVKPRCNSLEAAVAIKQSPPPDDPEGAAYAAACYALAGRIDSARALIEALPAPDREQAASVVFRIGHPVADMGDDESAGPIMELVVEYQPTNFMALYHAGMSEFILGQNDRSRANMTRFLEIYHANDGWTQNARKVLERLSQVDGVRPPDAG